MFKRAFSIIKDLSAIKGYSKGIDNLIKKGVPKQEAEKFMTEFVQHPKYNPNLTLNSYINKAYFIYSTVGFDINNFVDSVEAHELKLQFNPSIRSHINLVDSNEYQDNRGKLFVRKLNEEGKSYVREANKEEVDNANVFAVGGIDFDTKMHMSSLLKAVETLKQHVKPQSDAISNAVAIFPQVDKSERYESAVKYNLDKSYSPKYIKDFVQEFILPRMHDIEKPDKLKAPETSITFFSYSVGGREIYMIENALRNALLERSHSLEEIFDIFKYFIGVSVGYAVDMDGLEDTAYFTKIIIYHEGDSGVLQPKSLANLFRKLDHSDGGYIHKIDTGDKISHDQCIFFLENAEEIWGSDKFLGHGLNSYLKAIDHLETEARETIGQSFYSYDSISFAEY